MFAITYIKKIMHNWNQRKMKNTWSGKVLALQTLVNTKHRILISDKFYEKLQNFMEFAWVTNEL